LHFDSEKLDGIKRVKEDLEKARVELEGGNSIYKTL
jgi:hypothetical protein